MFNRTLSVFIIAAVLSGGNANLAWAAASEEAQLQSQIQSANKAHRYTQAADATYDLACFYNENGRYAEAEKLFQQSIALEDGLKRAAQGAQSRFALACVLIAAKRFTDAKSQFASTVDFAERNHQDALMPTICTNASLCANALGDFGQAEALAQKGLSVAQKPEDKAPLSAALASALRNERKWADATTALRSAVKQFDQTQDQFGKLKAMQSLATVLSESGNKQEAIETRLAIVSADNSLNAQPVLIDVRLGLAEDYCAAHQPDAAIVQYSNLINQVDADKSTLLIRALIGRGCAYADALKFKEALADHEQALARANADKLTEAAFQARLQLVNDWLLSGDPERALSICRTMRADANFSDKSRLNADVLALAGRCYSALGEADAAEDSYKKAAELFGILKLPADRAMTSESLACLYLNSGNLAAFDTLSDQLKMDFQQFGTPIDQTRLQCNLAHSLILKHDYSGAINAFEVAEELSKNLGDAELKSTIFNGLGLAYFLQKDYPKSLSSYQQALAVTGDGGTPDSRWNATLGLGKALKAMKRFDEAEKNLTAAIAIVESERASLTKDAFKLHQMNDRKDCYTELIDLYIAQNKAMDALVIAEQGKARAFLDMLCARNSGEKRASSKHISLGQVSAQEAGSRGLEIQAKKAEDLVADSTENALSVPPPSADDIKSVVRSIGCTCVEFYTLPDRIYTWVVDKDGTVITVRTIAVDSALRKALDEVGNQIVTVSEKIGAPQRDLATLYSGLIGPIAQSLPSNADETVVLVPDRELYRVPFSALWDSATNAFLVEKHSLSYAPGIGLLGASKRSAVSAGNGHNLLALGNPITAKNAFLGSLPHAEMEAQEIGKLFGGGKVLIGAAATKQSFFNALSQATEIHFATHGLIDVAHPLRSMLILAPSNNDDGVLTVADILNSTGLHARLVVLSACQTGNGLISDDGVIGFARAFIVAGAPSVVAAQWNVDDAMTEIEMKSFYQNYLKDGNKARALRTAQLTAMRQLEQGASAQANKRANPRYWAAFQLIGQP